MGCDRCIQCISRAILKPVHQFGIPNSDPKTPKSIKINSSKNRQTTVHALVPQCFELFKMQYSQKFSGPSPLDQSGEGLQCTPSHLCLQTSQLHKGFCPHQACQKASPPPPPQKKKCWIQHWHLKFLYQIQTMSRNLLITFIYYLLHCLYVAFETFYK